MTRSLSADPGLPVPVRAESSPAIELEVELRRGTQARSREDTEPVGCVHELDLPVGRFETGLECVRAAATAASALGPDVDGPAANVDVLTGVRLHDELHAASLGCRPCVTGLAQW